MRKVAVGMHDGNFDLEEEAVGPAMPCRVRYRLIVWGL